jgi:hypothetical protein
MPKGDYDLQGFTDHELKQYVEITFRNMVQFYKEETFRLLNGELASTYMGIGFREPQFEAQEMNIR